MTERTPFEEELRQFVPVPTSVDVPARIAAAISQPPRIAPMSRADRFLLSMMSLGAAAAVLIVTLLALDHSAATTPDGAPSNRASVIAQTQDDMTQLAAGRDPFDSSTRPQ
jgi:hypothetical protein